MTNNYLLRKTLINGKIYKLLFFMHYYCLQCFCLQSFQFQHNALQALYSGITRPVSTIKRDY